MLDHADFTTGGFTRVVHVASIYSASCTRKGVNTSMPTTARQLRRELRNAGIVNSAIDAVWPQWWSDDAEGSLAATAELTYTVARRLGLTPSLLLDGSPQFMWRDEAKFKNLTTESDHDRAVVASFGIALGRTLLEGVLSPNVDVRQYTASALRDLLLAQSQVIGLPELLTLAWSVGVPTIQLGIFPLGKKRMHAMTVQSEGRWAILLARASNYLAPTAYLLAHEIGHIALGHLGDGEALVEMQDPLSEPRDDAEEQEADRFALTLLTGEPTPIVTSDEVHYTATQLADAAMASGPPRGIDPGILALCLGHATNHWKQSYGALKIIPPGETEVGGVINGLARQQVAWGELSLQTREYLTRLLADNSYAA